MVKTNEKEVLDAEEGQIKRIKRKYDSTLDPTPQESRTVRRRFRDHFELDVVEHYEEGVRQAREKAQLSTIVEIYMRSLHTALSIKRDVTHAATPLMRYRA